MDALEFLKEERRMCASFDAMCVKCPLGNTGCCVIVGDTDRELENEVAAVEQWSKEYPIKTRQSELLRVIPNLKLDKNGSIFLCPATITGDLCGVYSDKNGCDNCYDCRKNFWSQEVE